MNDISDLVAWNSFFIIVGSSAGALIGLQFVVMALIAERSPPRGEEAGPAFATPTIVHFGAVLLLSAVQSAPWQEVTFVAAILGLMGLSGVVYISRIRLISDADSRKTLLLIVPALLYHRFLFTRKVAN
jgi:hypothetical protein